MELLSFSVEVLEEIVSYLAPKDLISLSQTCKKLKKVTERDQLWDQACLNEFGIHIPASSNGPTLRYYKNVLQRYGHMLGLWIKRARCYISDKDASQTLKDLYGGLLQVTYLDGHITGFDLLPPKDPNFMEPLRPMKLFTISMDEAQNGKAIINCFCSIAPLKHDVCELTLSDTRRALTMKCSTGKKPEESDFTTYIQEKIAQWIPEQTTETNIEALERLFPHFVEKFYVLSNCAVNMVDKPYVKFDFLHAGCDFPVPIQPGLFKGTCSSGIQLVLLSYTDQHSVCGSKITGDQSCPAGYCTFLADLKSSIYLNEAAQASMEIIQQMNVVPNVTNWSELSTTQPFILPQGCNNDQHLVVPNQCRYRFNGLGIVGCEGISPLNFTSSTGHWMVFNEDLFGFLWFNSRNFSLFHRVSDRHLLQGQNKNRPFFAFRN